MQLGLENKVALVTGGATGIGRAVALELAKEKARIVLADVNQDACATTCEAIKKSGCEVVSHQVDVSNALGVKSLIDFVVNKFGGLDLAVNSAGIQGELASTIECTEENWDRIVGTNLRGVWLCLKYEIAAMLPRGRGSVVNISSNFGLVGSSRMPAYSASKHGVIGLTKTAAIEFSSSGIRVNAVCPGPTDTPLVQAIIKGDPSIVEAITSRVPIGRMASAQELAESIVWLSSDRASFVAGAVLSVDGGYVAQ
jgi:NAD(P)-dependent dehydrogenase (short-subunit alcohol dehydrogenase family)